LQIVVLGAGLAGLSVAYHLNKLGIGCTLVEREKHVGGLASTYRSNDGFVFDKTLHVLHTRTKYVESLIYEMLKNELIRHRKLAKVLVEGNLIPYPFQSYFYLSSNKSLVKECRIGLEKLTKHKLNSPVQDFEDYIYKKFGEGIAKFFMVPYNKKLWTISLKELSYEWTKRFVPAPNPSEVLQMLRRYRKLKSPETGKWGYNPEFLYFKKGGIQRLADSFFQRLHGTKMKLCCEAVNVDLEKKEIGLNDRERLDYDLLVSTIPLPELVEKTANTPSLVKLAKDNLRFTSIYNINLGLDKQLFKGTHWIYFPDSNISFYRIGFPSNLSSNMAPSRCSSMSIEISHSKNKPINFKRTYQKVISDLTRIHLLDHKDDIIFKVAFKIKYAYVIPDLKYISSRRIIIDYFTNNNVFQVGRFGAWQYSSMEDAIVEGRNLAFQIANSFSKAR
jgi:protoporphyrinogen oxidase